MRLVFQDEPAPLPHSIAHHGQRFSIFCSDMLEVDPTERYFADRTITRHRDDSGRFFGRPRPYVEKGARPGTLAFLDWHHVTPTAVYIDYLTTRRDVHGRGLARQLVEAFYAKMIAAGVTKVDWHYVIHEAAWHLFEDMRERHPAVKTVGQKQIRPPKTGHK
jgi:GNAT superfamily N-acetyltransferase